MTAEKKGEVIPATAYPWPEELLETAIAIVASRRTLQAYFAREGLSRATGYRLMRRILGMSIIDAQAHFLAALLAHGATKSEAFSTIGVSRATGYRLLNRKLARYCPPPARPDDWLREAIDELAEAWGGINEEQRRRAELEVRKRYGGKRIYLASRVPKRPPVS